MTDQDKGSNHEEIPLEKIVLSNMYSMEALIDILVEKGPVAKEEDLKLKRRWRRGGSNPPMRNAESQFRPSSRG